MACDYNCYVEGKKTSYRIYICPWGILIWDFYGMRSVGDKSFVSNFENIIEHYLIPRVGSHEIGCYTDRIAMKFARHRGSRVAEIIC